MADTVKFIVTKEYDGTKAGRFLRSYCKLSARSLSLLKRTEGGITANGSLLRTVELVREGDLIEIKLPDEQSSITPVKGELDVLFEDEYLLIVNKPAAMPVHPVKIHQTDTLSNIIAYRCKEIGSDFVFRAINRLDRDTSGIVIVAKDRHTASLMQNTKIDKHYYALCHGTVQISGTVNAPIALSQNSKIVRCVSPMGQNAVTHYKKIKSFSDYASLVDLVLETGRTHQIRCHMSYIGHPLLGDDLYGGSLDLISRQSLHCYSSSFIHPFSKEMICVNAQLPADMKNLINRLEAGDYNEK
ncbi:MAG: RluA family pseudouridine synthase [Ruminococcus sp.]|nr:RluA family pseudouridine synthase [Ruminococcus sp.]